MAILFYALAAAGNTLIVPWTGLAVVTGAAGAWLRLAYDTRGA